MTKTIQLIACLLISLPTLIGQSRAVQAPFKYVSQFEDIYVDANDAGWVVGSCGVIASTTNGGGEWKLGDSPGGVDYETVACPVGSGCSTVILGTSGVRARSTNAGETWDVIDDSDWNNINELHALDGDVLVADFRSNIVSRSTDAGVSWTEIDLPTFQSTDMTFVDASNGYYFDSNRQLVTTSDGGATWVPQTAYTHPVNVRKVAFLDNNTAWITDQDRNLFTTTDGGASWSMIGNTGDLPSNLTFLVAISATELRGVQVTDRIYESSDGGATWTSYSLDMGDGVFIKSKFHRNGNEFFLVSNATEVYYSPADFTNFESQFPAERIDIGGIAFEDESTGYALADGGTIFRTTNAGDDWEAITGAPFSSAAYFAEILPDGNLLVMTGNSHARVSSDGGETFEFYLPDGIREIISIPTGFAITPSGRYYFMGFNEAVYSDDGGENWQLVIHELGFTINDLYFFDDNLAFVAGTGGGRMARTTDGGLSWENLTDISPTSQPLNTFYFTDTNNGMAFNGSRAYRTTDGGDSWESDNTLPGAYEISETPNGDLYANKFESGNNGGIYRSTDQGASWTQVGYTCAPLRAGTTTPNGTYYFVAGDGGIIERYDLDIISSNRDAALPITGITAYPNPTTGWVTLELPETQALSTVNIQVFDAAGRMVYQGIHTDQEQTSVDLSNQPLGIYAFRVQGDGWLQSGRVIRQ